MSFIHPHILGPTMFFTVALARRGSSVLIDEVALLRAALRDVLRKRPFHIDGFVVLPDHLHAMWTLPATDPNASERWGNLKAHFSRHLVRTDRAPDPPDGRLSARARRKGEVGIWAKGFHRQAVTDAASFDGLRRYCWQDPVKHGLVKRAVDWPYSSIHRDLRMAECTAEAALNPTASRADLRLSVRRGQSDRRLAESIAQPDLFAPARN